MTNNEIIHNLNMAKIHTQALKSYLDLLKENDFTLDTDALEFVYELSKKIDSTEIKGGVYVDGF